MRCRAWASTMKSSTKMPLTNSTLYHMAQIAGSEPPLLTGPPWAIAFTRLMTQMANQPMRT